MRRRQFLRIVGGAAGAQMTAKALGLRLSATLPARADEVIE